MNRLTRLSLFVLFASLTTSSLLADPPGRVARLNYVTGDVSFRPAGVDDWTGADINRVLIPGDELWADAGSRVELHIGSAAVRASESTDLGIVASDDQIAQLRLSEGTIDIRLRSIDEDQTFEIDTPTASVSLLRSGSYRIYVTPDGNRTQVSVRSGEAEATVSDGGFPIRPSQMAIIDGSGDSQTHQIAEIGAQDDFDGWSGQRDARDDRAVAANRVPIEMVGYEDLEDNGTWQDVAGYGRCWSPTHVNAGWAPYRDGHWAWINPWGWTWVDDSPWGFAPYHYGRWANSGGRWFWAPGQISVSIRPVFAPALVVFAGGSALPGGHGMAWFPLAPGEIYIPSYRVAPGYTQRMNAPWVRGNFNPATVNMTTVKYRNQRINGAVTIVSTDTFQNGRPVSRGLIPIQAGVATRLVVAGSVARIAPSRGSVLVMPASPRTFARPPAQVLARPVRALVAPPPPPLPFAVQQKTLDKHPGRPLNSDENKTIRVSAPKIAAPPVRPALPRGFVAPPTAGHPAAAPPVAAPVPVNRPVPGPVPGSAGTFQTPATTTAIHQAPPPRPIRPPTRVTQPPNPAKPAPPTTVRPTPPTTTTQGGPERHGPPAGGGAPHNPPTSTTTTTTTPPPPPHNGGPPRTPPSSTNPTGTQGGEHHGPPQTGGTPHNPPTSTATKPTTTTNPPPHNGPPAGSPRTPPATNTAGTQGGEHHGPPQNGGTPRNPPTSTVTRTTTTTATTATAPPPPHNGPAGQPRTPPATNTNSSQGGERHGPPPSRTTPTATTTTTRTTTTTTATPPPPPRKGPSGPPPTPPSTSTSPKTETGHTPPPPPPKKTDDKKDDKKDKDPNQH